MSPKKQQERLKKQLPGALIVLTAHDALQQTADMAAPFRQDAAFLWLTGINEPGWKAIFESTNGRLTLVRPKKTEVQIIFDGESDDDHVVRLSAANAVIDAKDFESFLREKAKVHSMVYGICDQTDYGFINNPAQKHLDELLKRIFSSVQSCEKEIMALKAIKLPEEIVAIQKAVDISVDAFTKARDELPNLRYEYEIEALFSYEFGKKNAKHAYEPIVANGQNACTLHYVRNGAKLQKVMPTLIDIGAIADGYCADITRTYMLKPTKYMITVHEALVRAQRSIIELLKPGLPVIDYLKESDLIMKQTLLSLDLIESLDDEKGFRTYFPHAVSHGLGIDVHDSLGRPRFFEEGMVLTVEPGIYINEKQIGIRIEDDILITSNGYKNLSAKLSTDY